MKSVFVNELGLCPQGVPGTPVSRTQLVSCAGSPDEHRELQNPWAPSPCGDAVFEQS